MWTWVDWLGLILFDAALSTTTFLGLILFPLFACRQPARRIFAARVALAASLATIPLVASAAWPRFDLIRYVENHGFLLASGALDHDGGGEAETGEVSPTPPPVPAAADFVARHGPTVLRAGSFVYLLGVLAGGVWLALGYWGVHRLIRESTPPSAGARRTFDHILDCRGSRGSPPDLRVSTRIARPVLVGFRGPTIVLPDHLDVDDGSDRLRLCLLHELAHFERGDHWYGLVVSVAQTIWFFVPPLWWLRSRLLVDQEFLADRAAAQEFGNDSSYAASLLSVAELAVDRGVIEDAGGRSGESPAVPSSHGGTPLLDRMLVLLHCPYRLEMAPPRAWRWRLYLLITTLSLAATVVRLRWPDHVIPDHQLPGTRSGRPHSFRVAAFSAAPLPHPTNGRSLPYVLPVMLPERFRLELEILVSPSDLAHLRIAGHLLSPFGHSHDSLSGESLDRSQARWHTLLIERHGTEVLIHIDGLHSWTDNETKTTPWLTLEPCSPTSIRFRNLSLTW